MSNKRKKTSQASKKKKNKTKMKINRDIIGIGIIGLGIIIMLSLFSFRMGIIGSIIRGTIFSFMGFGGYIIPIAIIAYGTTFIINKFKTNQKVILISGIIIILSFLTLLDMTNPISKGLINRINKAILLSYEGKGGGIIGGIFGYFFFKLFGSVGSYVVLGLILLINILVMADIRMIDLIKLVDLDRWEKPSPFERKKKKPVLKNIVDPSKEDIRIMDYSKKENEDYKGNQNKETKEVIESIDNEIEKNKKTIHPKDYILPSLGLLKDPLHKNASDDKREILSNAKKIEETMKNFGIDTTIVQINKGPTITCYELELAPGIKVSRILSLSDNIALSLATSDIRIEAPIPGKSAVGIEVPNRVKDSVLLKEILESEEFNNLDTNIPLALGKDVAGKPIISTIDKMPHLLIAGATGSGKSVCINSIIMSILYKSSPDEVKLLLIDPKMVELSVYNGIPHLLIPVVTDAKKAAFALDWAVGEMERRYKLFAKNSVRDIASYNSKIQSSQEDEEKLPKIVIIIDELADLMMIAAQDIEDYICRLAQMARAAGMYLIVATQRPSVDVITGTIKANIPSRISFAVSSQIDSRTILDMSGAEKLLGQGDMLFYPSFYSKPGRIQGAFISEAEVENVVDYLKKQNITQYNEEIIEVVQNNKDIDIKDIGDELLPEAIEIVVNEGQASISFLQRRLRIGYARAARLIDEMEAQGIVGGHEGSKPRKVLISKESLMEEE